MNKSKPDILHYAMSHPIPARDTKRTDVALGSVPEAARGPQFETQMHAARKIMAARRNLLSKLAD